MLLGWVGICLGGMEENGGGDEESADDVDVEIPAAEWWGRNGADLE